MFSRNEIRKLFALLFEVYRGKDRGMANGIVIDLLTMFLML
jgi:hypothetical protein